MICFLSGPTMEFNKLGIQYLYIIVVPQIRFTVHSPSYHYSARFSIPLGPWFCCRSDFHKVSQYIINDFTFKQWSFDYWYAYSLQVTTHHAHLLYFHLSYVWVLLSFKRCFILKCQIKSPSYMLPTRACLLELTFVYHFYILLAKMCLHCWINKTALLFLAFAHELHVIVLFWSGNCMWFFMHSLLSYFCNLFLTLYVYRCFRFQHRMFEYFYEIQWSEIEGSVNH
jgi:hypothetical protein